MKAHSSALSPVLRTVALAMGIAVVVLTILDTIPQEAGIIMLGIGLFAISIEAISGRAS